jgi:CheY-like chemotaxis protein
MSPTPFKMLVADDATALYPLFRQAAAQATHPIDVFATGDGRECMDILGRGVVDLAFIDVFMPTMSGLEALANARFMGNKTFVALMSGRPEQRCFELARRLNVYEFLTKPFELADVESIIKTFERARRPMKTLIVDDSATVRSVVRRVLERSMFRMQIEEAADGAAALTLCEANRFDLVFLDYNMPGLHGLDTLERLRLQRRESKVVVMSAEYNEGRQRQAIALGAEAFLRKPFCPAHVNALVHRIFELPSPKLTIIKPAVLDEFDVTIVGRTVAVAHSFSGHLYQYIWFREPPHLRTAHVSRNEETPWHPGAFRAQAEKAALLELRTARLVN